MANFCPKCGSPADPNGLFCQNCGQKLMPLQDTEQPADFDASELPPYPEIPVYPDPPARIPDSYIPADPLAKGIHNTSAVASVTKPAPLQSSAAPVRSKAPASNFSRKSNVPLIFGIAAVLVLLLFVVPGFLKNKKPKPEYEVYTPTAAPDSKLADTEPVLHSGEEALPESELTIAEATDIPQDLADFLRYNIPCDCVLNQEYPCPAIYDDGSREVVYGDLTFLKYESTPVTDEMIRFGSENNMDLNGYDKRILKSQVVFTQSDLRSRGAIVRQFFTDYYDIDQVDNSYETLTDSYGENYYRFQVTVNGSPVYAYLYTDGGWTDMESHMEYSDTSTLLVPSGYDGIVRGYVSPNVDDVKISSSPNDMFLFRMK